MPGSGVAAAWEIAARLPSTKVVMLTVSDDDADLFAALRPGAEKLVLSASAVRVHIASIVRKLQVGDRAAVVELFGRSRS